MADQPQRQYPLCSWHLRGFRSIRDDTTFEFSGLNLLVGANSAGKSSVLHSLLMVAQTLGNPLADRPLVLNGSLVRLGLAEDTIHQESHHSITIGFALTPASPLAQLRARYLNEFTRLDVRATFAMEHGGTDFGTSEVDVRASAHDPEPRTQRLAVAGRSKTAARAAFREAGLRGKSVDHATKLLSYSAAGDIPTRSAGVRLRQFLPEQLLVVANTYEEELELLRWPYLRYGAAVDQARFRRARQRPISRPVLNFMASFLQEEYGSDVAAAIPRTGEMTIEALAEHLPGPAWQELQSLASTDWFAQHRGHLRFNGELQVADLPDVIGAGVDYARRWFQGSVRHLGPLRAAPQPLYNLPEAASGTSVGPDGEYTAAVLSAHARRLVLAPDPTGQQPREIPLGQAVDEWMSALGLLATVRSQERGKLGYELHLRMEGVGRDLDLTTVGVGVSQALPIVVLGLISQPGGLLLFEQPELHLHPDVQAALGDFFLALAQTGRQLIVETHSEYLINRLRRRAATSPELNTEDIVRLFFFERAGSTATVRPARIGAGGSMSDWPRGFLDTAVREVQAIARASK
ncbi:MAG: hypothetical protein QOI62_1483 [Solirubrobacteraceae bacterium]|jgi:predicted ATPase|nr:hypothetical protein [Solirubrobacteraceae bacterium]